MEQKSEGNHTQMFKVWHKLRDPEPSWLIFLTSGIGITSTFATVFQYYMR